MNTNLRVAIPKQLPSGHVLKELFAQPGRALTPEIRNENFSPFNGDVDKTSHFIKVGKYVIQTNNEAEVSPHHCFRALNIDTNEERQVKIFPTDTYKDILAPYFITGCHHNIANISEIIVTPSKCYTFFDKTLENLHFFIRKKHKLKEREACCLFKQIVEAVRLCHDNNVVVRDIKLRKFVFIDSEKKHLILTGLEEGLVIQDDGTDTLYDKHGCLAYISPEILHSTTGYSGKASDVWSLGVVLYTMLVGQYPFHDNDIPNLFKKIRSGAFVMPDFLSAQVKCLLKNLLRIDPSQRLTTDEILDHPWFETSCQNSDCSPKTNSGKSKIGDQFVPELPHSQKVEEQTLLEDSIEKFL